MRQACISLIFVVLPIFSLAQQAFSKGYILMNNGDTIHGLIKNNEEKQLMQGIVFSEYDKVKSLGLDDITGFGFDDGNNYQKIHYADADKRPHEVFAHVLVTGYYRLYSFVSAERPFYVVKNIKDSTWLLYDDEMTNDGIIEEQGNFRNTLLFFARDCEIVKKKLNNINFVASELANFIIAVNRCVSPSSETTIAYVKPESFFRYYVYAGGITFGADKYDITGRLMARYTVPSLDRKTSLNFGISYMKNAHLQDVSAFDSAAVYNKDVTDIVSIPLIIQYNFLKGPVQPYINGGICVDVETIEAGFDKSVNMYYPASTHAGISIDFAIGLECPINNNLMIKADWTYDLVLHYPVIGVAYWFK